MEAKELEYRMYGLVPYNISPIQQGIQFGHAVVEYAEKYFKSIQYRKWAEKDKTFIILNGGTTNSSRDFNGISQGSLNQHADFLSDNDITFAHFREPDLQDALTAVVFLVDERVWDKKKYPDYDTFIITQQEKLLTPDALFGSIYLPYSPEIYYHGMFGEDYETIVTLRKFLSQFKFA